MTVETAPLPTLAHLIRTVLDETDCLSPDDVADEVVNRTPAAMVQEYYRRAVRDTARIQMGGIPKAPPVGPVRSVKYAKIAAWWERALADRVCVDGTWMTFGECTRENVETLAEQYQALADQNRAKADQCTRLAKELANAALDRVADLPATVLETALAGA